LIVVFVIIRGRPMIRFATLTCRRCEVPTRPRFFLWPSECRY